MPAFRFGKHPAKNDYRTLRFKNYAATLAAPPESYNVLDQVGKNLDAQNLSTIFPMDGNDVYGDCTIAALAHATTVFEGLVSKRNVMSTTSVEKLYFKLSGGVDSGLQELDVLNYWRTHKVAHDSLDAFVKIDRTDHTRIKQAIKEFGGVYLGFQVQQDAQADFQARRPWTPGPLTRDGHAVYAVAYDAQKVTVLTWGSTQDATWDWWDECVDEAYALLPKDAEKQGFAPGFNFAQLKSDLAAVAD
jgi:hypothetical protein